MCCGSKRSAWRGTLSSFAGVAPAAQRSPVATLPPLSKDLRPSGETLALTRLRYEDAAPIRVRGPITGRAYLFSGDAPVQEVDVRDAAVLVTNARLRLAAQ
jgi:hypothetical protein